MRYPVEPIVKPKDLAKIANGKLPQRLLAPAHGGGQLHHIAAAAWKKLVEAAAKDGVELDNVGAYRTYDQQVSLFKDRYQATPNGSKTTRRWNGITYYLKQGKAPSATPGTSNHGWGLAIDVANIGSGKRLEWLLKNAPQMGWSWEMQEEPWHIRYVKGDEGAVVQPQQPTTRTLQKGDTGKDVEALQWALTDLGYLCKADGKFGPVTEDVVKAFQKHYKLTPDGIVGPKTKAALGI